MAGIRENLRKYTDARRLIRNSLDVIGVFDGEYAYRGPDCVQIDLTNDCNNNCIACWCNSPLLEDKATPPEVKSKTLDYRLVIRLIERLSKMGTRELFFSGGGEPLMHPQAIDILTFAKKRGFTCHLNTNFTLVNENILDRFKRIKLDHLIVSLWAATAETYVLTHPNRKKEDFHRMVGLLEALNRTKSGFPSVRVYNVISNLNYKEIPMITELAFRASCELVEFTVVDTIPGRTDRLVLSSAENRCIEDMCRALKNERKYYKKDGSFLVSNFEHFMRRVSSENAQSAEYDKGLLESMPCYVGWLFSRVLASGDVNFCLKAHRIPVGNLYLQDFASIWNASKQRRFRREALMGNKNSDFFAMIGNDPDKKVGCYKSCDDLGRNMCMHEKINGLAQWQKDILKKAASFRRLKRKVISV